MAIAMDLKGDVYGKLTVIEKADKLGRYTAWLCRCECGVETVVRSSCLRTGNTKTCGCSSNIHGHNTLKYGRTAEYSAWNGMLQRCDNEKNISYEFYGAKGVKVCDRWRSFESFIEDMGVKPTKGHSIDRIDVYGDYEPSNCKWSTRQEQDRNLRIRATNKTGTNGVHYDKTNKKYRASIGVNGKTYQSKRFDTSEEATQARREMELKYWGESNE